MKQHRWLIATAAALISASAVLYGVHYLIFHDYEHIFIYLVGDIAFVPIEVLLVAIILERLLARHEKQRLLHKLNMLTGTFFTEVGVKLLGELTDCIDNRDEVRPHLAVDASWTPKDYKRSLEFARTFNYEVNPARMNLPALKETLLAKRDFLLLLLANPHLLEHERFTDLLWAIFHFAEEVSSRGTLDGLPDSDRRHLAGDAKRIYALLTCEWLLYCRHLQHAYPYIFSIIVRTHPLQDHPSAIVK